MSKEIWNSDHVPELPYHEALSLCAELFYDILAGAVRERNDEAKKSPSLARAVSSLPEKVVAAIRRHGPLSPRELRAILSCSPMTLTRTLKKLINSGKLSSRGSTRSLRYECVP